METGQRKSEVTWKRGRGYEKQRNRRTEGRRSVLRYLVKIWREKRGRGYARH